MGKSMVIDAHCHLFPSLDAFPPHLMNEYRNYKRESFRVTYKDDKAARKATDEFMSNLSVSGTIEECLKTMDEAGIDISVVSVWDSAILCNEEPKIPIWEQNEYVADAQKRYPDRIIGLVGIDPLRKGAAEIVERGITQLGLKGVKVYSSSCPVTDERLQPLLAKLNEIGLPVLFHSGSDPLPFLIQYGNPADLDALTLKYPKIKIQAGHCSRGYEQLLAEIIHYREGIIYQDLSGLQFEYQKSPWHFLLFLRYLMDRIPGSVLMGTDWPWLRIPPHPSAKEWFDFIRNLKIPKPVLDLGLGIKDFTQEEKDRILGLNAMQLYGL